MVKFACGGALAPCLAHVGRRRVTSDVAKVVKRRGSHHCEPALNLSNSVFVDPRLIFVISVYYYNHEVHHEDIGITN